MSDLQVSNYEIGRTLEILLAGRKINTFIDNGEEYYVILQAKKKFREDIRDIGTFEVKTRREFCKTRKFLSFNELTEAKELNRYNKMRSITLSAGLKQGFSLGQAISYLEEISKKNLKGNFKIGFKGQSKEYKKKSSKQFYFLFFVSLIICLFSFMCTI